MIRDHQFKLCIRTKESRPYLLFDMINDPYEMINLVENSEYKLVKDNLLKLLKEKMQ